MIQIVYEKCFMPYEFDTVDEAFQHIFGRCLWNGILQEHSLVRVERETEHLELRCPVVRDYIHVYADSDILDKLEVMLVANFLY